MEIPEMEAGSIKMRMEIIKDFLDKSEIEIKTGPFGTQLKAAEYQSSGTPVLNVKNLGFSTINAEKLDKVGAETVERLKAHLLKAGDIVFGRKGAVERHAFISVNEEGWMQGSDCIRLRVKTDMINPRFLSYYFLTKEHRAFMISMCSHGTTMASLNQKILEQICFPMPQRNIQDKIVDILEKIDRKIALNNRINDNLQQQAAALFESWFVNLDPWNGVQPSDWENAPLGSFVEIKRGGSPRPIQDYLSDSGLRWLKISDVTSLNSPFVLEIKEHIKEDGLRKTVFLHAGELVLSNSATPGIPKILDVDTCIHDGWLYFPKSELSKYYLYLFFKHIRKELVALGNGSVFTNLKTDILKAFPATKADKSTLKEFDALVAPLFNAMLNADRENFKLAAMRDALLPKLMSGEVDVSAVDF